MMKNNNGASENAMARTTTTEELIVQYLDGELVRKELETVLFERLAHSDEARALLREYLVVRGAIRQSTSDERFQLSADLDGRTRRRIEQMFERIAVEGFDVVFPAAGAEHASQFLPDRSSIGTNPFTRRTKQWSLRSSLALLALLFAVGTTWFVTRTTEEHASTTQIAANLPAAAAPEAAVPSPATTVIVPKEPIVASAAPERSHFERARNGRSESHKAMVASVVTRATASTPAQASEATPAPQDVMISDRFGKAIEAAKHEVVISSRDRL